MLKFMLHISCDEQRIRFQEQVDWPSERWKFKESDLTTRQHWDEYMQAHEDEIAETSTDDASWYVVPADHYWYSNLAVARIVTAAARRMHPQYPEQPPRQPGRTACCASHSGRST